ncbi:MAG TPA: Hpt domain-containing protein [Candidatus Binatia bacterium]|nr:Hpt domain-containing protein [Candidatus Binatia bacterium]
MCPLDENRAAEDGTAAVFEFDRLRDICGDDATLEREFLEKLLHTTPDALSQLDSALAAGDPARVRSDAHSLKGSCLTLGAAALGAVCEQIESTARRGDLDPAHELLARARTEFHRLRRLLDGYLARGCRVD